MLPPLPTPVPLHQELVDIMGSVQEAQRGLASMSSRLEALTLASAVSAPAPAPAPVPAPAPPHAAASPGWDAARDGAAGEQHTAELWRLMEDVERLRRCVRLTNQRVARLGGAPDPAAPPTTDGVGGGQGGGSSCGQGGPPSGPQHPRRHPAPPLHHTVPGAPEGATPPQPTGRVGASGAAVGGGRNGPSTAPAHTQGEGPSTRGAPPAPPVDPTSFAVGVAVRSCRGVVANLARRIAVHVVPLASAARGGSPGQGASCLSPLEDEEDMDAELWAEVEGLNRMAQAWGGR